MEALSKKLALRIAILQHKFFHNNFPIYKNETLISGRDNLEVIRITLYEIYVLFESWTSNSFGSFVGWLQTKF